MEHGESLRPIGEVLRALGVCRETLWRWERAGVVSPYRDHRGHRFYDATQVEALRQHSQPRQPGEAQ